MMNINNNPNSAVARASRLVSQTANRLPFDCARIRNCIISSDTCSTSARVAGCALTGAAIGATLMGPCGLGSLITTKFVVISTCDDAAIGAIGGAIGGGVAGACAPAIRRAAEYTSRTSQNAEPVSTQPQSVNAQTERDQPQTRRSLDDGAASYHAVATSDRLPLMSESEDEL